MKTRGVTHVVFGDIAGDSHRDWNEKVCAQHGLTPVLPLWGEPTADLAREFLARGGEARFVTVRPPALNDSWLGIAISEQSLGALERLGVDSCGEFGGCWAIDFALTGSKD